MIDLRATLPRRGFTLDVALALPMHGVSALFGASGCGKTTLLRVLAGLEHAAGTLQFGDEPWQDDARRLFVPPHRRPIGYVFQEAALFPHLSVRGNLDYGLRRTPVAQRRLALDQAVALLGIGGLMARRPDTLSGGERQRVAIARALATSPRLLLMDEPLAALDLARKAELLPWLERLVRELALPIVYVSHSLDEVARLADTLVLLDAGRVRAAGPLSETLARTDLPLPLGEEAGVVLDATVESIDARWHLARLALGSARDGWPIAVWARDTGLPPGARTRLRVLARDVSLTRAPQQETSIGNQLPATVEAIADDEHPAHALVRVRAGPAALLARVTRRSVHTLALEPGTPVWALVKTVALLE